MTDLTFHHHQASSEPAAIRPQAILNLIRAAGRTLIRVWTNRPRFQTWHQMVADYDETRVIPLSTGESLLFDKLPTSRMQGLY